MTQAIDPIRLKAAVERRGRISTAVSGDQDAQGPLSVLVSRIRGAVSGDVSSWMGSCDATGTYNFADGSRTPFKDSNIEDAYITCPIELWGALVEQEQTAITRTNTLNISPVALAAHGAQD